jgi:predicted nucleic acid-binding protein
MSVVFDGCIAIKWFFDEDMSAEALNAGQRFEQTIAPALILPEVANAVWKRMARSEVSENRAKEICETVPLLFRSLVSLQDLHERSSEIMIYLNHPIYDCVYLALAEREKLPLITVDRRLIEAGRGLATVKVIHLQDL